mgnify:FL=1
MVIILLKGTAEQESETHDESVRGFTCPHCGRRSREFRSTCPECGRPFMRDYIDWRMYPRDPERRGTLYYNRFWARVWLVLMILGLAFSVLVMAVRTLD